MFIFGEDGSIHEKSGIAQRLRRSAISPQWQRHLSQFSLR
jgi:hypothetical protein